MALAVRSTGRRDRRGFRRFLFSRLSAPLRWVRLRRWIYAFFRRIRLWRLSRFPRMPLDDDLFEIARVVAERTDDILSSIHSSADPEVRTWLRNVEPKIRELATMAFRLVGIAQELRTALSRVGDAQAKGVVKDLWPDFLSEQDSEMQCFMAQTLKTEQHKSETLDLCRHNLRLVGIKLGTITSFLDSVYLRIPNVKVLADRREWFANISFELDTELRSLEETFEEFRQLATPLLTRPSLSSPAAEVEKSRPKD